MELFRYGNSYTRGARDDFAPVDHPEPELKQVRANFLNFGRGYERTSDFGVNLRWPDIEEAIKTFSEMGHPDAIRLRNALNLAKAAEEAGWKASDCGASN